LNIGDKNK